jgi:DNA ligase-associated metallophosphoesterase
MKAPVSHSIREQHFWLSEHRAIFWEEQQALILSDLHLGKSGHFRKSGIAIPQNLMKDDMQRLIELVQHFQPRQLIIVGDLFHSKDNKEHEFFLKWRQDLSGLTFHLIQGNHDILLKKWYKDADVQLTSQLNIDSFIFCHDIACVTHNSESLVVPKKNPAIKNMKSHQSAYNVFRNTGYYSMEMKSLKLKEEWKGHYIFSGHVHPGVIVNGLGKQSLRFPCFYFSMDHCILPAFGTFTGLASVHSNKNDVVYAIVEDTILKIS